MAIFLLLVLIVNASYLSYKYINFYFLGGMLSTLDCADDCDAVMMSKYALLLGVPTPIYGLVYFLGLAFLYFLRSKSPLFSKLFNYYLILGLLVASGFLYVLYFVLHMSCKFCLISHVTLFIFAVVHYFIRHPERSEGSPY
jgi:uncharacterized membrane protein